MFKKLEIESFFCNSEVKEDCTLSLFKLHIKGRLQKYKKNV